MVCRMSEVPDECFRCGYDLRGIASEQPCPECGLLAERSRRVTDELHDTRPRWLRSLARGVWLILAAMLTCAAWPFVLAAFDSYVQPWRLWGWGPWPWYIVLLPWLGIDFAALLFVGGVFLLTVREGYPPADRADGKLRVLVRVIAFVPLLALVLAQFNAWADYQWFWRPSLGRLEAQNEGLLPLLLATIGCAPLPLLLFLRLRGLARRARSAHLAEHCLITGIGASASLLYFLVVYVVMENGNRWFGDYWTARSNVALVVMLIMATASAVFLIWTLYLLVRFAIAFARARRLLRRKWASQDFAAVTASPIPEGSR